MDRREEESAELCVICGEEVDLLDPSAHVRVRGRVVCRQCGRRLGGVYDSGREEWSRPPSLPDPLKPRKD